MIIPSQTMRLLIRERNAAVLFTPLSILQQLNKIRSAAPLCAASFSAHHIFTDFKESTFNHRVNTFFDIKLDILKKNWYIDLKPNSIFSETD